MLGPCQEGHLRLHHLRIGSLERMDEQIRELMGEMLVRNLANVEQATDGLLHRLGRK